MIIICIMLNSAHKGLCSYDELHVYNDIPSGTVSCKYILN